MTRPGSEQPPARQSSEPAPGPERGPPATPPRRPEPGQQTQQRDPGSAQARRESRPGEQQVALTRPSAVPEEAHLGDIEGALGRIRAGEEYSSTWRRRLVTFLAIVGPG
jgi:hypothetical protein